MGIQNYLKGLYLFFFLLLILEGNPFAPCKLYVVVTDICQKKRLRHICLIKMS